MVNILAIVGKKGGVLKSSTARSLAVQAIIEGKKAVILDVDPQATCVLWGKRRESPAPSVVGLGSRPVAEEIKRLEKAGAELVIIDCPPSVHPVVNTAIQAATSCIICTEPLPESLEQVGTLATMITGMKKPAAILITRVMPRTSAFIMAKGVLATFGVPVCPTAITLRIVHAYASSSGQAAQEYEPKGKAAEEIKAVYDWLAQKGVL